MIIEFETLVGAIENAMAGNQKKQETVVKTPKRNVIKKKSKKK